MEQAQMEQSQEGRLLEMSDRWEWVKLIRKLRWIGLEDEARRLELAVSTLPPEQRGTVLNEPSSTD
jgi:hypothetical protein